MAFPSVQSPRPAAPTASLARRDRVETLLRERKLDRTLTTAVPDRIGAEAVAPFGLAGLDARLSTSTSGFVTASFGDMAPGRHSRAGEPEAGGGLPRGQISELIGPVSSGRTSLAWTWLGAATARGESAALIDTFDRFDPATAATCGIDLSRLLWVRGQAITKTAGAVDPAWLPGVRTVEGPGTLLERTIDRSLKALNLALQSGVCTAVVLDFADVPVAGIRRVPLTTWLRLQRIVEGSDTACLLIGPVPLTRSAGGVSITTGAMSARWAGNHDRSRRLAGLSVSTRLSSPRRTVHGTVALETVTRTDQRLAE
jgi:recombination protein RecA